jgi:hypothetical protein
MDISRRKLFGIGAGITVSGLLGYRSLKNALIPQQIPGRIIGANFERAHKILNPQFPAPSYQEKTSVLIVGGGISGLSAGYHLKKRHNFNDFKIIELEDQFGGNSRSGESKKKSFPWGAHYVPLINDEDSWTKKLFEEFKIIEGYTSSNIPIYNDLFVCSDPQERLFLEGRWQEGLIPRQGIPIKDQKEIDIFFALMKDYKSKKGSDSRFYFSIPLSLSSRDPEALKLDEITMIDFLNRQNLTSSYLRWYINYCCLDDYGTSIDKISAWAGIHYFSSRRGRGDQLKSHDVLTWPEGNSFLASKLLEEVKEYSLSGQLIFKIENRRNDVLAHVYDFKKKVTRTISADHLLYCAPRFSAFKVISGYSKELSLLKNDFDYTPWMVANITVKNSEHRYTEYWDNVNYHGRSLGFIDSSHQNIGRSTGESVWTLYWPLVDKSPRLARIWALKRGHHEWVKDIITELDLMIPEIEKEISNIDVCLWGHPMLRPKPGFYKENQIKDMKRKFGRISFAHSDMMALSIFEHAHTLGVEAAEDYIRNGEISL